MPYTLLAGVTNAMLSSFFLLLLSVPLQGQVEGPAWRRIYISRGFSASVFTVGWGGTLFVATELQGVFKSRDNGTTWKQFPSIDEGRIDKMYVHTTGSLFAFVEGRLCRLTDTGTSLIPLTSFPVYNRARLPSLASDSSGGLLLGDDSARVFRSSDDGDTWTALNSGKPIHVLSNGNTGPVKAIAVGPEGEIYAGMVGLLYYSGWPEGRPDGTITLSTDGGASFQDLDAGTTHPRMLYGSIITSIIVNRHGDVFCGTEGNLPHEKVFVRSTNKGATWSKTSDLGKGWGIENVVLDAGTQNILLPYMMGEYNQPAGRTIFRSTDNGVTFSPSAPPEITRYHYLQLVAGPDRGMWALQRTINSIEHVLWRSLDGGSSWEAFRGNFYDISPPNTSTFICNAISGSDVGSYRFEYYGTAGDGMIRRFPFQGLSWTTRLPIDTVISITADRDPLVYATDGHSIFRSIDRGENWSSVATEPLLHGVTDLAAVTGGLYAVTGDSELLKSSDSGAHWEPVQGIGTSPVQWISSYNGEWVFAGTAEGMLIKSPESGSWIMAAGGIEGGPPRSVAGNPATRILIGNDNGVYSSVDSGASWQHLGMADSAVIDVILMKDLVVVRTANGIYGSNGLTPEWAPLHSRLKPGTITMIGLAYSVAYSDASIRELRLVAGVEKSGLFDALPDGVTHTPLDHRIQTGGMAVKITSLPNPASGRTEIRFSLRQPGHFSIDAFNLTGAAMPIAKAWFEAGDHAIEWDLTALAAGLYQVRLSSPTGTSSTTVIVQ